MYLGKWSNDLPVGVDVDQRWLQVVDLLVRGPRVVFYWPRARERWCSRVGNLWALMQDRN
jgi:hypothetical protein